MKVVGMIIRWMIGLVFSAILFFSVAIIVPFAVAGQQVLQRESAMRWIDAISKDEAFMSGFVTGILEGISESEDITEPELKAFFLQASNENTEVGKVTRKVFDNKTMAENITTNAVSFYDWLEGKKQQLIITFKVGGTTADQTALATAFLTSNYEAMPVCTQAELMEMAANPPESPLDAPCKVPGVTSKEVSAYANEMLNDVEIRKILRDGFTFDTELTPSQRDSILVLQQISQAGLILAWVIVGICVLLMLVLFAPKGVNFLMTGVVVGLTGATLMTTGGGMLALVTQKSGISGAETIAQAFSATLGKPIAAQGMYLLILAGALIVIGIWQLAKKEGTPVQEAVVESEKREERKPVTPEVKPAIATEGKVSSKATT